MKTELVPGEYFARSVNASSMDKITASLGHRNRAKRLLWHTPSNRTVLKNGDLVLYKHFQVQYDDGEMSNHSSFDVPVAVYSASVKHIYVKLLQTRIYRGEYYATPITTK